MAVLPPQLLPHSKRVVFKLRSAAQVAVEVEEQIASRPSAVAAAAVAAAAAARRMWMRSRGLASGAPSARAMRMPSRSPDVAAADPGVTVCTRSPPRLGGRRRKETCSGTLGSTRTSTVDSDGNKDRSDGAAINGSVGAAIIPLREPVTRVQEGRKEPRDRTKLVIFFEGFGNFEYRFSKNNYRTEEQ